uniref:Probable prefoldin subunit 6 n=1 Tax=Romanomermis culicivorax TaxID=13658 RepID=A0A915I1K6_ROMCU
MRTVAKKVLFKFYRSASAPPAHRRWNLCLDMQKFIRGRQQLEAQLTENNIVKDELDRLKSEANVFKMIGPALVKQDLSEAKQTVAKRIEYINGEITRHEQILKDFEKKQDAQKETLNKLQQQLQQAQVKAAIKS